MNFVSQVLEGRISNYQIEKRYFHQLGHEVWIQLSVSLVKNLQGQPRYFIAQIQDISSRKLTEKRLSNTAQWLETVLNSIGDGVISTDTEGHITFLNPAAEKLTGWSLKQAVGKDFAEIFQLVDGATRKIIENPVKLVLNTGEVFHLPPNTLLINKNGREIFIEDSVAPVINHGGVIPLNNSQRNLRGTVIVFKDVTERHVVARKLYRKAYYDSLTNLPNRDWFMERLTDAVERVKRNSNYLFAVLLLDLDRFKTINDTLGHLTGDQLLVAVAERLTQAVRSFDTVSRLGGDEFAILLESLQNSAEACKVARRIIEQLSAPIVIYGKEISTNCSVGIVLGSTQSQNIEELLRNADIAMYRAKEKGRGRYEVFDTEMYRQIVAYSQLENELRLAIAENQLTVYYQPIISLPTQKIVSFEALVRWLHPTRGLISPAEFIPIAEDTGLITQIDLWVLREACRQLKVWQQKNSYSASLVISVNLSSRHFTQADCVRRIKAILDEVDIEPSYIRLEITETTLIKNTSSAVKILAELKALGFTLSLDDFGTGYSSLCYLQQFPLDVLKIDRCFISQLHHNCKNATLAKAMIDIAHQLDLKVVAEGVETVAELAFLSQHSCDSIQGYLYSPPLATTELKEFKLKKQLLNIST